MTASPIKAIWNHPLEVATAVLFVFALVYTGTSSGGVFILGSVGVVAAGALLAEIHIWLSGEHKQVMAARRAVAANDEGKDGLRAGIAFAFVVTAMAEFFWYHSAFYVDPRYGVMTTTPTAWLLAHVAAVPAVLTAYRHSPLKYRAFLSIGTFACVISALVVSSIVPFYFA